MKHFIRGFMIDSPFFIGLVILSHWDAPVWQSDFARGVTTALLFIAFFWLQGWRISRLDSISWLSEESE